jgi:hypothetical protein
MLDNLRDSVSDDSLFEEMSPLEEEEEEVIPKKTAGQFLGMTAIQRFVIALMLFLMTCVLSALCLLVTGRIELPFL